MKPTSQLKQAERGAILSICTYVVLAFAKMIVGRLFFSQALIADGLNNFTDIISSVFVLIGLRASQKPIDENHPYGHRRFETVASLATSFIMLFIGIEVLRDAIASILSPIQQPPSMISAIVGFVSGIIMLCVYRYNHRLAQRLDSLGLKATAKDNFSDALTSFSTAFAILVSALGIVWIDSVMALIVSVIILRTAFTIFKESSFELTDGFHSEEIEAFKPIILAHPEVKGIRELKARRYSSIIYLDITVMMDPHLTVAKSHDVTEDIENELRQNFSIHSIDIHVEPFQAPSPQE